MAFENVDSTVADLTQQPVVSATQPQQGTPYANNGPVMPGTLMPVAPTQQQAAPPAPDIDTTPKLSGVDAMVGLFFNHLLQRTPPPPPQNPTQTGGSFASKLQSAIQSAGAGLGDAAGAAEAGRSGGGWLAGVEQTMANRSARLDREQQVKFDNQERLKADKINTARANSEMLNQARSIQRQDVEIRNQAATSGAAFMSHLRDGGEIKVQDNISQDQLNAMLQKDPSYLTTHTGRIVGYEPVYDANGQQKVDGNGNPVESPIYSIAEIAPGDVSKQFTVNATEAQKWKAAGLNDIPAGSLMPASVANELDIRADRVHTTLGIFNSSRLSAIPNELKDQLASTMQDSEVQHAVAMYPGNALGGLYTAQKNINDHISVAQQQLKTAQQKGDQQAAAAAQQQIQKLQGLSQNLDKAINLGFSDADREKYAKDQEQARKDAEKERHDQAQEDLQNRRADIQAAKETQQKGLGDSYKTENKEFDTIRKPLDASLGAFSTLRSSLDQGTAAGDSVVAPALLKALVAGGGVRITQAEISNFTHGRSTLEDMKGYLQKLSNGKSITPEQRKQVYSLLGAVEAKAQQKNEALEAGQDALDNANSVQEQRQAVQDTRRKLSAIDAGQYNSTKQPQTNPQGQTIGHKVGDTITQNGRPYTVTAVDASGKVTGAQ